MEILLKKATKTVHTLIAMLIIPTVGLTDGVSVDPGYYTGSRMTPSSNGVVGTAGWSDDQNGFKISWTISPDGSNFDYSYTITGAAGGNLSKGISHVLFEISDNINNDNFNSVFSAFNISGGGSLSDDNPRTFSPTDPGNSNPGLPGDLYGFKVEDFADEQDLEATFSFTSTRAPMWGDFYAVDGKKPGKETYAYNIGFGNTPNDINDFLEWIPVPNTQEGAVITPEPATLFVLGSSLTAAALAKRRRKK